MHYIPVALSLTVSFMSAITILGNPAEIYTYGMMLWWLVPAFFIAAGIISEVYIPIFYRLDIKSSYEYLEMRFNRVVRVLVTAAFIVETIMYAGIVIYAPSLALSQVTGFNLWAAVLSTGLVCTFYTTLGGLKGVIWTDVFQAAVMISGLLAVLIRGSVIMGGFTNIWEISGEGGRLNMAIVDPDPKVRHSIWTLLVGGTFLWLGLYAVSQSQIQRYICCRSEREAKMALFLNAFGLLIVITLTCLTGLVTYAYFHKCDPIKDGKIPPKSRDRLLPYLVMEILQDYPGVPGIFVACVYSGGLSTISTGINAMACVTVEDFIKPCTNISKKYRSWISRGLGILYGLACIGMAYIASQLGGVLQAAISIFGIVGGPLIGVYTLGIMFAFANSWGAAAGLGFGLACTSWMYVGAADSRRKNIYTGISNALPTITDGCPSKNLTFVNITTSPVPTMMETSQFVTDVPEASTEIPSIVNFYSVSYLYYGCIGFAVTLFFGIIVSLLSCGWRQRKHVPQNLLRPPFDHWFFRSWIPESIRRILRFGIDWEDNIPICDDLNVLANENIVTVRNGKPTSDEIML
uniref:sodium-coupled monocarboxylate transporter 1-like n=1 Tax=Styela clava TaxID=7725 RepID=UPI00193A2173|nr:sodium-coupled monocarboxylate transporter 1-like [Styela clava]